MRHRQRSGSFGRDSQARKVLFQGLALSLIEHEQIKTTVAKAKELRRFIEPIITIAGTDSVANRRLISAKLRNNKKLLDKLFLQLGVRYKDRPGGYLRIIKAGFRAGDSAPMAIVQFVHVADELAERMAQLDDVDEQASA